MGSGKHHPTRANVKSGGPWNCRATCWLSEAAAAGVAAALAASALGRLVVLTEAGSRVGGQLTSQAVPPDEHPWVEITGTTASYRQLRDAVRTRYKQTRRSDRDSHARSAVQSRRGLGEQSERRT